LGQWDKRKWKADERSIKRQSRSNVEPNKGNSQSEEHGGKKKMFDLRGNGSEKAIDVCRKRMATRPAEVSRREAGEGKGEEKRRTMTNQS